MKKRFQFFVAIALSSLILSGCSGITRPQTSTPSSSEPSSTEPEPTPEPHHDEPHTHSFEGWQANEDEHWKPCAGCEEVSERGFHEFELVSVEEKTCDHPEISTYRCSVCGYEKFVHGKDLDTHTYASKITKEATCVSAGIITFTCSKCGDSFTQEYFDANAHEFVSEGEVGGVTTYHCAHEGCEVTKQTIVASEPTVTVTAETLSTVGEVEFESASIAFDEDTLSEFSEDVTISVEPKSVDQLETSDGSQLTLDESVVEKIGDNQIIDFSLKNGEEQVSSFSGSVNISVPYELKANEDPNALAVWYLDDGEPQAIEANYTNGKVAFETTHFSYYAVVHLTPEEVCESFGHIMVAGQYKSSTCVTHGYDDEVCRRCGFTHRTELPLVSHQYQMIEKVDATTVKEGYIKYRCQTCGDTYSTVLPMLPIVGRGFYANLIYTSMTCEMHQSSITKFENGDEYKYDSYSGSDYEGLPFTYYDYSDGSYGGLYKGYRYSSYGFDRYQDYSNQTPGTKDLIVNLIDYLPDDVKRNIEQLGAWLEEKFFVKTEIAEGYEFTLNLEAIEHTYQDLRNGPVGAVIEELLGHDMYEQIVDYLLNSYESTIDDILDDLAQRGYVLETLYDIVVDAAKRTYGEDFQGIPALEDIFTEELRASKLVDVLIQFVSSRGAPQEVIDMIPTNAEALEEMLNEYLGMNLFEIIAMYQGRISKEELIAQADYAIETLKNGDVDIAVKVSSTGSFISMSGASTATRYTEDGVINGISSFQYTANFDKSAILLKLKALADKCDIRYSAFDLNIERYSWFTEPFKQYLDETYPGIDFEYVRGYHDWGTDALVSTVKVERARGYYEVITPDNPKSSYESGSEYQKGYLVILLNQYTGSDDDYGYYYNKYSGYVVQNRYGLGSLVKKGDYGIIYRSDNAIRYMFMQIETEGGLVTDEHAYLRADFQYLYSFSDNQIHTTDGSYDYLNGEFRKISLATKADFLNYNHITEEEWEMYYEEKYDGDDHNRTYIFYRVSNILSGSVYYSYRTIYEYEEKPDEGEDYGNYYYHDKFYQYHLDYSQVISTDMNDEALEHSHDYEVNYYYVKESNSIASLINVRFDNEKDPYREDAYAGGYYDQEIGRYVYYTPEDVPDGTLTKSIGNATIEIVRKTPSANMPCQKTLTWRVVVGGKTIISDYYKVHYFFITDSVYEEEQITECVTKWIDHQECTCCGKMYRYSWHTYEHHYWQMVEDSYSETPIEGEPCMVHIHYEEYCERCGEYRVNDYDSSRHQYQEVTVDPTLTMPGYCYNVCSECHQVLSYYANWISPCRHEQYHFDGDTFICDNCGYTCETNNHERPELIYEDLSVPDSGVTTFGVFAPNIYQGMSYYHLNDYYDFYIFAGVENEEGGYEMVSHTSDDLYIQSRYIDTKDLGLDNWYLRYFVLEVDELSYMGMLDEARMEYPDKDVVLVIGAVARDSGTIFYYAL